jgi:hypothetical protein
MTRHTSHGYVVLFVATVSVLVGMLGVPERAIGEDEPLMIAAILEDPEAYHLRMVTMKGTVRDVRERGPYLLPNGTACYGAYTFLLEDDSGMLEVAVVGICGRPALRYPDVANGDRIVLHAEIQAPGHGGAARNLDGEFFRLDHPSVQGIAKDLRPAID